LKVIVKRLEAKPIATVKTW